VQVRDFVPVSSQVVDPVHAPYTVHKLPMHDTPSVSRLHDALSVRGASAQLPASQT
jgi:hypothetical protein